MPKKNSGPIGCLIVALVGLWAVSSALKYLELPKLGGFLPYIVIAFVVFVYFIFKKRVGIKKKTTRGMDYIQPKQFYSLAKKLLKNKRSVEGIKIHPNITMDRDGETEHISVIGTTGAGKTKGILNRIYKEASERGDKIILWDVKGDFTESLGENPGVLLVAPWDERSIKWDIAADILCAEDCDVLAESAIPDTSDSKESFFRKQGRAIFSAILQCLWNEDRLTWKNLAACIYDINETLALLCQYKTGQQVMSYIDREGGQSQATWTTVLDNVGKWISKAESAWDEGADMSFQSWLTSPGGGTLILRYSSKYPALSASVCAMVTSLLINTLLLQKEDSARAVWFLMDEMANFPKVANLKRGITLARDRGGRFVLSAQDVTQLFPIYGKEVTKTLINQCNTQIWLRANDAENAKLASESLGNKEEILTKVSESKQGQDETEKSYSTSQDLRTVAVVEAGEIMALRHAKNIKGGGAEGFFKMSGIQGATKLVWPLVLFEKAYASELPAAWVNKREQKL